MRTNTSRPLAPWLMLVARPVLFAFFQLLIAGGLALTDSPAAWDESAAWWPFSVLFANFVTVALLILLFRREGGRYLDITRFSRNTLWNDLGIVILLLVLVAPISTLPNIWLAKLLYGSSEVAFSLFFRPLPFWAKLVSFLMPVTIAFAELPTYFGYVMPRLEKQLGNGWLAWMLASFFLAFQHIAVPLIFDWRFMLWRLGMFIPFALFVGLVLKLRPRLFPYLMIGHALMDAMLIVTIATL
jgi:hypothetical protein